MAPLDNFLERHRFWVVGIMLAVAVLGLPLLRQLRFDFNPTHLSNQGSEAIVHAE